jgi:hypothetical protein
LPPPPSDGDRSPRRIFKVRPWAYFASFQKQNIFRFCRPMCEADRDRPPRRYFQMTPRGVICRRNRQRHDAVAPRDQSPGTGSFLGSVVETIFTKKRLRSSPGFATCKAQSPKRTQPNFEN